MAKKLELGKLPDWPLLMTTEEASRYLGLSVNLFRELSPVEAINIRSKTVRFHREDLMKWANQMRNGGATSSNDSIIKSMFD